MQKGFVKKIKKYLTPDEYKVYKIIYSRAIASLMADAKVLATSIVLDNNDYKIYGTKVNGGKSLKSVERCEKFAIII